MRRSEGADHPLATASVTIAGISIAPVQPGDLADLLAMIRALAEYEKLSHLVVADQAALAKALFGEKTVVEALIARESQEGGSPAGFALFFPTFSTFLGRGGLWLEDLFIYPAHRRRGIGRALLSHLAGIAHERGCGRFEWAVLDWNAPAIQFYERLGATLLSDWRICRVVGPALDRLADA